MVSKRELQQMRRAATRDRKAARVLALFNKREERKHRRKARRNKAG